MKDVKKYFHDFCSSSCQLNSNNKCTIIDKKCPVISFINYTKKAPSRG